MDRITSRDDPSLYPCQLEIQSVYKQKTDKNNPPSRLLHPSYQCLKDPRLSLKSCETQIVREYFACQENPQITAFVRTQESDVSSSPRDMLLPNKQISWNIQASHDRRFSSGGTTQISKNVSKFPQTPRGMTSVRSEEKLLVAGTQRKNENRWQNSSPEYYMRLNYNDRRMHPGSSNSPKKAGRLEMRPSYESPKISAYGYQQQKPRNSYHVGHGSPSSHNNSLRFSVESGSQFATQSSSAKLSENGRYLKNLESTLDHLGERINFIKNELIMKKIQSAQNRASHNNKQENNKPRSNNLTSLAKAASTYEVTETIIFYGDRSEAEESSADLSRVKKQTNQESPKDSIDTIKKLTGPVSNNSKNMQEKNNSSNIWNFVQSQPCPKEVHAFSHNPYSPRRFNIYYVSEIIRARHDNTSLAKEHIRLSINFLRTLEDEHIPDAHPKLYLRKNPYYNNKKTLIFDLDQTLVHCVEQTPDAKYDVKLPVVFPTGEQVNACINIRPYALTLLNQLVEHFELIVFTASHECYANVVIDYIDPEKKLFQHRLFRQHCFQSSKDMYVKDMRIINRDLSEMVLIDNAAYSYAFQVENGVPILPYYEGRNDFEMKALEEYLMKLRLVKDVREVNRKTFKLHHYLKFNSADELIEELYLNC